MQLLSDRWIPAVVGGDTVAIRPDQIAEPGVARLAWDRPDFNLACLELLIGLVSMADPPRDDADWRARLDRPDAVRLRKALAPFAPLFSLSGDGPRFLQDLEPFEKSAKASDIKPVDVLYIDSAGNSTAAKNADLTVKRDRFASLPPAEAAMALYTLQAFAPTGGAGNRTSMRGGGPMTTLIHPRDDKDKPCPLWRLVFANVVPGSPLTAGHAKTALPWLRPTRTSEQGQVSTPQGAHALEAFFGMPRRFRLMFRDGRVTGVVQRPYGTNYATWEHPLTPYYRRKEDDPEWLPVHPKAGRVSYRNWLGTTMEPDRDGQGVRRPAKAVRMYYGRPHASVPDCELTVGGWAMDNMKPVSFALDRYPGFSGLGEDGADRVRGLVDAANAASGALRKALKAACNFDGTSAAAMIEAFFADTEADFEKSVRGIIDGRDAEIETLWLGTLTKLANDMFDDHALDGLTDHDIADVETRIVAKRNLRRALARQVRKAMELPLPGQKDERA